ncbi:hypothetical protein JCM11641_004659 [Rhodosporidiobolus odoratus]
MNQDSIIQQTRINEVNREETKHGQPAHAESATCSAVSLLDLPDKILSLVFQQLHTALFSSKQMRITGIPVPLRFITVNKRTYRIALPFWLSTMNIPDEGSLDRFLTAVIDRP